MIPQYQVPEISEFMLAFVVGDHSAQSSTMNVFIPKLMLDKKPGRSENRIPLSSNIIISRENIRTSSFIVDTNYIPVDVSRSFNRLYSHDDYIEDGSRVRLYVPDLCIENAIIIPFM